MSLPRGGGAVLALLVALASFACLTRADGAEGSCPVVEKSTSMTLRSDLFCNYDPQSRPVKNVNTAVNVSMFLYLSSIDLNDIVLTIHGKLGFYWRDAFLQWNASNYEDRIDLSVSSSDIWVPDIELYTTADMSNAEPQLKNITCQVNNTGDVSCFSSSYKSARCNPDLTRWPFDQHNCTMRMGSWMYIGQELNISLNVEMNGTDIFAFNRHLNWDLDSSNNKIGVVQVGDDTYQSVIYNFILKRHSHTHVATVITPALILVLITLTTFCLDPGSAERVCLLCLLIVCHCVYLQYLGKSMPRNGVNAPLIVHFFRDSLLMVGVALLVSLFVRKMIASTRSPPVWAVALASGALDTLPGQIILFSIGDDPKVKMRTEVGESSAPDNGWRLLANIVDRITFIIFLITFFVLMIAMYA